MYLTKGQLKLLTYIVAVNKIQVSELADNMETSRSYTSRVLKELQSKGFINLDREGTRKTVSITETQHAVSLRNLMLDQPHLYLGFLANKGMSILAAINSLNLRTGKEIEEYSGTSFVTLRKYMTEFKEIGLVQKRTAYFISPRFSALKEFLGAYQDYTHLKEALRYAPDALVKWGCGERFLLETDRTLNLQATGITAFPIYGAKFITVKNLYIHTKKESNTTIEDHLINHVLSEKTSNMLPLLITWRMNYNRVNEEAMREKAYRNKIREPVDAVITYLKTRGRDRPQILPEWNEFNERYREYV